MTPDQRARALRLADERESAKTIGELLTWALASERILRELAAEPERVPLTSERAIEIVYDEYGCERHGIDLVRAVERAHGITGDAK